MINVSKYACQRELKFVNKVSVQEIKALIGVLCSYLGEHLKKETFLLGNLKGIFKCENGFLSFATTSFAEDCHMDIHLEDSFKQGMLIINLIGYGLSDDSLKVLIENCLDKNTHF